MSSSGFSKDFAALRFKPPPHNADEVITVGMT